jgi:hypothetical protein
VSQSQTELSVQDRCCISLETSAVYTSTNLRLPKPLRWLWLCGSPAAGGSWRRGASTSTWSDRCGCVIIVHGKNGTLNRTKQEAKEGRSRRGRRRKGEVGRESERPIPKSYPLGSPPQNPIAEHLTPCYSSPSRGPGPWTMLAAVLGKRFSLENNNDVDDFL